jgi:hypothetical protein
LTPGPLTAENRLVSRVRTIRSWGGALGLALLALPVTAVAQVSPTAPPHPTFPWALGVAIPQGQLIRYIYVPPQAVSLEYIVPGVVTPPPPPEQPPAAPEGEAKPEENAPAPQAAPPTPEILRQDVTIPGYYVRETTVGFHYPERWMIEPAGPNVYRWRQIPAQFVPK